MDTVAKPVTDDVDLDALMLRVREAAMTGAAGGGTVQAPAAGAGAARELDLIRVLEAQGDWNDQARQSLAALADCIRTLRDDWATERAGLRQEIGRLSTLVEQLRAAAPPRRRSKVPPAGKRRSRA